VSQGLLISQAGALNRSSGRCCRFPSNLLGACRHLFVGNTIWKLVRAAARSQALHAIHLDSIASRGLVPPDRLALLAMPWFLFPQLVRSSTWPWGWPGGGGLDRLFASGCKRRRCGWVCPGSAPFVMREGDRPPRDRMNRLEGIYASSRRPCPNQTVPQTSTAASITKKRGHGDWNDGDRSDQLTSDRLLIDGIDNSPSLIHQHVRLAGSERSPRPSGPEAAPFRPGGSVFGGCACC